MGMVTFMVISPTEVDQSKLSEIITDSIEEWMASHSAESCWTDSDIEELLEIHSGSPDEEYASEELEEISVCLDATPRTVLWISMRKKPGAMELARWFANFFIKRCRGIIDSNGLTDVRGDWVRDDA